MSGKRKTFDYIKKSRNHWDINPRTRIQEHNSKNKKKRRQQEKKMIKDGLEE